MSCCCDVITWITSCYQAGVGESSCYQAGVRESSCYQVGVVEQALPGNMSRNATPAITPPRTPLVLEVGPREVVRRIPCVVCGRLSSGFHYGADTCSACKVRRHLVFVVCFLWTSVFPYFRMQFSSLRWGKFAQVLVVWMGPNLRHQQVSIFPFCKARRLLCVCDGKEVVA